MKKKGFTLVEMIAVVIIIAIIAILAVPPILQSIRNSKQEISEAMEKVIVNAADVYMSVDKDAYVKYNGNRYCITLRQLVESENLANPIYDPINSQEISQDKFVKIDIANNEYSYKIVDTCEEIRQSDLDRDSLITRLKSQYKEGNQFGFIKEGEEYYYRDIETVAHSNYVWYEGHLWRVLKINSDNTLTMITNYSLTSINLNTMMWYNAAGYEATFANKWLNNVFLESISDKSKLQLTDFNIAQSEKTPIYTKQYAGLIDYEQYYKTGGELSFLYTDSWSWTGTPRDSSSAYVIGNYQGWYQQPTNANGIRPVVRISDLTVAAGDGSLMNPYREKATSTNTSDVKVGEYISVPVNGSYCNQPNRCLFRVVSKDDNSIKVILNGVLPTTSYFGGSNGVFSNSVAIVQKLSTFENSIPSKYRNYNSKQFNIGSYTYNTDYATLNNETYRGTVGLPVIGEMFSGDDINITTGVKKFVNIETIENPFVANWFFTMNRRSDGMVNIVSNDGTLVNYNTNAVGGIRPTLFLNKGTTSDLTFTQGDGTAENPFVLGN